MGFSPDGSMVPVAGIAADRHGHDVIKLTDDAVVASAEARVGASLHRPSRARDAVEVASLRDKDLQAAFNDLGVSEADDVEASLPPEPTLSVSFIAGQGDVEVIGQIVVALYAPALLPACQAIAAEAFHAAQSRAAGRVMALACRLGLSVATRQVSDVTITAQADNENAGGTGGSVLGTQTGSVLNRYGFVADIEIPSYDWGEGKVRGARETHLAAANRLARRAIDARSQARDALPQVAPLDGRGGAPGARHHRRQPRQQHRDGRQARGGLHADGRQRHGRDG